MDFLFAHPSLSNTGILSAMTPDDTFHAPRPMPHAWNRRCNLGTGDFRAKPSGGGTEASIDQQSFATIVDLRYCYMGRRDAQPSRCEMVAGDIISAAT